MNRHDEGRLPSRRAVLRAGFTGVAGLAAGLVLARDPASLAWATSGATTSRVMGPPFAKTVIQVWMWGGPSHLDTFDPKPEAGAAYCGPYDKPIETNVKGIRIGQMLPKLAQQADRFCLVRSMTHGINAHETAAYLMQTGHRPGRVVCPSAGAVVSRYRGYDVGYKGVVPPYVVLTSSQGRFDEAGCLGPRYKPFVTGGDPNAERFVVEGIVAQGISDERQQARRKLLHELDTLGRALPGHRDFARFDQAENDAYDLMFGEARRVFDLSTEKEELRQAYGRNTFGQCCLVARRLAEAGVPYITINYGGWDTHKQHFQTMNRKLPELDAGLATLLRDLSDRGLLSTTIVWWGGEFGRTPKIQYEPPWNGGRSHFGKCFSVLLAGGGFKGGTVVGESDARGETVKSRPVYPRDLIGSIYTRMGIDPDQPLPNDRGVELRLLPPPLPEEQDGGLLKEIMPT